MYGDIVMIHRRLKEASHKKEPQNSIFTNHKVIHSSSIIMYSNNIFEIFCITQGFAILTYNSMLMSPFTGYMTHYFQVMYDLLLLFLSIPCSSSPILEPLLDRPCLCCSSSSLLSLLFFFFLTLSATLLLATFSLYRAPLSPYTMLLVNGNGKPRFPIQELLYSLSLHSANLSAHFKMGILVIQLCNKIFLTCFSLQIQHQLVEKNMVHLPPILSMITL